ncbi:hypothetical protein K457DRAFT_1827198 [Linnemannia elongata AG-77]|jgi:hypothetical protein|uniref:Uncharacterized protein n=1 Tax=Linnemannia elongata AG-77 TaxID=1314771 RepID=A0A197JD81_9FUNG|nr:hypothetical protein K457DRAFT_143406 [Linnemannia elongata AG-77]OAQ23203.1 hypothetical protein K457DRAFT_142898 [Linnemannia elongata AG-77]OAQ34977.1 hypothetical protein K457DRAFT_1827198 [Linnemannia elongata AG-77]
MVSPSSPTKDKGKGTDQKKRVIRRQAQAAFNEAVSSKQTREKQQEQQDTLVQL